MSNMTRTMLQSLIAAVALAAISTIPGALAQTKAPTTPSSVLPTGGGAALIDTSDSVMLLLDHQLTSLSWR